MNPPILNSLLRRSRSRGRRRGRGRREKGPVYPSRKGGWNPQKKQEKVRTWCLNVA